MKEFIVGKRYKFNNEKHAAWCKENNIPVNNWSKKIDGKEFVAQFDWYANIDQYGVKPEWCDPVE